MPTKEKNRALRGSKLKPGKIFVNGERARRLVKSDKKLWEVDPLNYRRRIAETAERLKADRLKTFEPLPPPAPDPMTIPIKDLSNEQLEEIRSAFVEPSTREERVRYRAVRDELRRRKSA